MWTACFWVTSFSWLSGLSFWLNCPLIRSIWLLRFSTQPFKSYDTKISVLGQTSVLYGCLRVALSTYEGLGSCSSPATWVYARKQKGRINHCDSFLIEFRPVCSFRTIVAGITGFNHGFSADQKSIHVYKNTSIQLYEDT